MRKVFASVDTELARLRECGANCRGIIGDGPMEITTLVAHVPVASEAFSQKAHHSLDNRQETRIARDFVVSDDLETLKCVVLVALEVRPDAGVTVPSNRIREFTGRRLSR